MPWTEKQLAYMAGIVDGEGTIVLVSCYSVSKGKKRERYAIRIQVYNNDPSLMVWLTENFGGSFSSVKRRGNRATSYQWGISHAKAAILARELIPYLVIKSRQAQILVNFSSTMRRTGRKGTPENILQMRRSMWSEMHTLNCRGVSRALAA